MLTILSPPVPELAWLDLLDGVKMHHAISRPRVFISYAWEPDSDPDGRDRQHNWLIRLADDLRAMDIRVFLDLTHMNDDMMSTMTVNIANSDAAIVVCTPRLKSRVDQQPQTNVGF